MPVQSPSLTLANGVGGLESASLTKLKVTAVRDLWVRMRVLDVRGIADVQISITKPQGDVAHEESFAFADHPDRIARVSAAGHPVDVAMPTAVAGGYLLDVMIPVAGTNLARYAVPGTWQVNATVHRQGFNDLTLTQAVDVDVRL